MEITRRERGKILELHVKGRLDASWADHLSAEIEAAIREGRYRLFLDLTELSYISSAGISVLLKLRKQLLALDGMLAIANASDAVKEVLKLTKLDDLFAPQALVEEAQGPKELPAQGTVDMPNAHVEILPYEAGAVLSCRAVGDPEPLLRSGFQEKDCRALAFARNAFGLGLGALGNGFADCRHRFGEFIVLGGVAAYQPTDRRSVPDYLVSPEGAVSGLQVLYGLCCEGGFAHVVNFESKPDQTTSLLEIASQCLAVAQSDAAGLVIAAEAVGLVGAALKRSPAAGQAGASTFQHPAIQDWMTFTSEPAYARGVALVAGVVARTEVAALRPMLRPLGAQEWPQGHLHAAAFTYRPLRKGRVDLHETVRALFEGERLNGILHLVNDVRPIVGAGQSEFVRGTCWVSPISKIHQERK